MPDPDDKARSSLNQDEPSRNSTSHSVHSGTGRPDARSNNRSTSPARGRSKNRTARSLSVQSQREGTHTTRRPHSRTGRDAARGSGSRERRGRGSPRSGSQARQSVTEPSSYKPGAAGAFSPTQVRHAPDRTRPEPLDPQMPGLYHSRSRSRESRRDTREAHEHGQGRRSRGDQRSRSPLPRTREVLRSRSPLPRTRETLRSRSPLPRTRETLRSRSPLFRTREAPRSISRGARRQMPHPPDSRGARASTRRSRSRESRTHTHRSGSAGTRTRGVAQSPSRSTRTPRVSDGPAFTGDRARVGVQSLAGITFDPVTGSVGWQMDKDHVWAGVQVLWKKISKPVLSIAGSTLIGTLSFIFSRPLILLFVVFLCWPAPDWYCSYTYEPCILRTHTESFTNMETRGIGALVNVSHQSFGRALDLITAATVVDDLRTMAQGRTPVDHAQDLNEVLEKYRDSLRNTSRNLVHVEASVWTLVETGSINNQLAYTQLSRSEKSHWIVENLWPSCSGPRASDVYRSFSQLLEALAEASIGTTRVAYTLRDDLQDLQTVGTALRLLANDMELDIPEDATDGRILTLIWDSLAPYWNKGVLDASRRRVLSGSRFPELRSFDYITAFLNELGSLKTGVDLARRSLLSSTSGAYRWILSARNDEECPPWSRKDRKPFQSLYSATYELREMMERLLH